MLVRERIGAKTIDITETMMPPNHPDVFTLRHIGPDSTEAQVMLDVIGHESMEEFIDAVIPVNIRQVHALNLPEALSEREALAHLHKISERNQLHAVS